MKKQMNLWMTLFAVCLVLAETACVWDPIECTEISVPSVNITLRDPEGSPIKGATVRYSVDCAAAGIPPCDVRSCDELDRPGQYGCGWGIAGRFVITANHQGFLEARRELTIEKDDCHPISQAVEITLEYPEVPPHVAMFRRHVEALVGAWVGTSKFVYENKTEPDVDAEELLGVNSLGPNRFAYDSHSIAGGLHARSFVELEFKNGTVVAVPWKDTLEPHIWTLTILHASESEVAYELSIEIPTISSHSREVIVERLAPDNQTMTRQLKLTFEDKFIGTRNATYTRVTQTSPSTR